MRVSSVLSVGDEDVSDEPGVPFVPSVPASPTAFVPAFLEDEGDWPEPVPAVDLDRVLETDWDEIAGIDLRHLFR